MNIKKIVLTLIICCLFFAPVVQANKYLDLIKNFKYKKEAALAILTMGFLYQTYSKYKANKSNLQHNKKAQASSTIRFIRNDRKVTTMHNVETQTEHTEAEKKQSSDNNPTKKVTCDQATQTEDNFHRSQRQHNNWHLTKQEDPLERIYHAKIDEGIQIKNTKGYGSEEHLQNLDVVLRLRAELESKNLK